MSRTQKNITKLKITPSNLTVSSNLHSNDNKNRNWRGIDSSLARLLGDRQSIQITDVKQVQIRTLTAPFQTYELYIYPIYFVACFSGRLMGASADTCMHQFLLQCKLALRVVLHSIRIGKKSRKKKPMNIIYVSVAQRNSERFFFSRAPLAMVLVRWRETFIGCRQFGQ